MSSLKTIEDFRIHIKELGIKLGLPAGWFPK
jgi:hypothetical protein